jgi:hypothetical protein
MASNSQEIIQDVQAQFEHLMEFVSGKAAQTGQIL